MKKKGISLIVLIITIVVIIILATAIIVTLARTNVIDNANEAQIKQDFKQLQEELNVFKGDKYADTLGSFDPNSLNAGKDYVEYDSDFDKTENNIYDVLRSLKGSKYKDNVEIQNGVIVLKGASERVNRAASEAIGNIIIIGSDGEEPQIDIKADPTTQVAEYLERQIVNIDVTSTVSFSGNVDGQYAWSASNAEMPSKTSTVSLIRDSGNSKKVSGTITKDADETGEFYLWVKLASTAGRGQKCFGPYRLEGTPTSENLVCNIVANQVPTNGVATVGVKKAYTGWKCYYSIDGGQDVEITGGLTTQINVESNQLITLKYKKEGKIDVSESWSTSDVLKTAYTLSYSANGGLDAPATQTQYDITTFTITTDIPTKDGYYFVNWKDTSTNTTYNGGDSITITSGTSVTLTAQWEQLTAEMFSFTPADSTWTGVSNVKQALDYLYSH